MARGLDIILGAKGSLWRISRQEVSWPDLSERRFFLLVGLWQKEMVKQMDLDAAVLDVEVTQKPTRRTPGLG